MTLAVNNGFPFDLSISCFEKLAFLVVKSSSTCLGLVKKTPGVPIMNAPILSGNLPSTRASSKNRLKDHGVRVLYRVGNDTVKVIEPGKFA